MRTLIISDVHANLTALNAVLEDAGTFERVWCLGDIIGYGPDPNECVARIAALPGLRCVKGNHDAAILGEIAIDAFNYEARASLTWLGSVLSQDHRLWLEGLDERQEFEDFTLVHGSPNLPIWEYIMDLGTARENMDQFDSPICLVGHTHLPGIYQMEGDNARSTQQYLMVEGRPFSIEKKCIINPGSVGQPRDHDPRAAYMVYDDTDHQWTFHRVAYDIRQVQQRILAAGLPKHHASRLETGW